MSAINIVAEKEIPEEHQKGNKNSNSNLDLDLNSITGLKEHLSQNQSWDFDEIIQKSKNKNDSKLQKVVNLIKKKKYIPAINICNEIDDKLEFCTSYLRSACLFFIGEYEKSLEEITHFIKYEPSNFLAKSKKDQLQKLLELESKRKDDKKDSKILIMPNSISQINENNEELSNSNYNIKSNQISGKSQEEKVDLSNQNKKENVNIVQDNTGITPFQQKSKNMENKEIDEIDKIDKIDEKDESANNAASGDNERPINLLIEKSKKNEDEGKKQKSIEILWEALNEIQLNPPYKSMKKNTKIEITILEKLFSLHIEENLLEKSIEISNKILVKSNKIDLNFKIIRQRANIYTKMKKYDQALEELKFLKNLNDLNEQLSEDIDLENQIKMEINAKKSEISEPSLNKKADQIKKLKDQGNEYFKKNKIYEALECYSKGIDMFLERVPLEEVTYLKNNDLKLLLENLINNSSRMNEILEKPFEILINSSNILKYVNKLSPKAFFHQSKAYQLLKDYKSEYLALEELVKIIPPNDPDRASYTQQLQKALTLAVKYQREKIKLDKLDKKEKETKETKESKESKETNGKNPKIKNSLPSEQKVETKVAGESITSSSSSSSSSSSKRETNLEKKEKNLEKKNPNENISNVSSPNIQTQINEKPLKTICGTEEKQETASSLNLKSESCGEKGQELHEDLNLNLNLKAATENKKVIEEKPKTTNSFADISKKISKFADKRKQIPKDIFEFESQISSFKGSQDLFNYLISINFEKFKIKMEENNYPFDKAKLEKIIKCIYENKDNPQAINIFIEMFKISKVEDTYKELEPQLKQLTDEIKKLMP